ncbi:Protein of unknown function [Pyronema omphalodes CBS 100304]|uniref:Uncharacterized protein n=1 Tax=Pyronema omphalodes (strain CBS 100304) TaxID=1076935 RepID=U4KWA8_PYROM|nr:Protein of unknown function [Pyronema omphalodes CBS 100304]
MFTCILLYLTLMVLCITVIYFLVGPYLSDEYDQMDEAVALCRKSIALNELPQFKQPNGDAHRKHLDLEIN